MNSILNHTKQITGIVLLAVLVLPVFTSAQTVTQLNVEPVNDFVLGPGKTEVFLEPGETVTRDLTVTSRITDPVTFKLETEDIVGSDNPGQTVVLLGEERGPHSIEDYVSLPITEFTLEFGERITIPVTISAPFDAEPGGHYGAILVSNAPDKDNEVTGGTGTTVVSRLGSIFLVRVAGDVEEEGGLDDFRVAEDKAVFLDNGPQLFEVLFRNSGSVHLTPYGQIEIKNLFGSTVGFVPVDAYFSLPDSLRYRQVQWDPGVLFGRYTADLTLWWGENEESESMTLSFWVIPWKLILIVLAGILLLSFFIYFVSTRFEFRRRTE